MVCTRCHQDKEDVKVVAEGIYPVTTKDMEYQIRNMLGFTMPGFPSLCNSCMSEVQMILNERRAQNRRKHK